MPKPSHHVYVIAPNPGGPCKIGITGANPQARLSDLQVGNWMKLKLFHVERVPFMICKSIERGCHRFLRKHALSGEWFAVSVQGAVNTITFEHHKWKKEDGSYKTDYLEIRSTEGESTQSEAYPPET